MPGQYFDFNNIIRQLFHRQYFNLTKYIINHIIRKKFLHDQYFDFNKTYYHRITRGQPCLQATLLS
jgi:hypothetical protein